MNSQKYHAIISPGLKQLLLYSGESLIYWIKYDEEEDHQFQENSVSGFAPHFWCQSASDAFEVKNLTLEEGKKRLIIEAEAYSFASFIEFCVFENNPDDMEVEYIETAEVTLKEITSISDVVNIVGIADEILQVIIKMLKDFLPARQNHLQEILRVSSEKSFESLNRLMTSVLN